MVETSRAKRPVWKNPWLWAFVAGVVLIELLRPRLQHIPDPPPVIGPLPEWTLTSQSGEPFGSEDLKGGVYVASFFFTSCVTICPHVQKAMHMLQERFERNEVPVHLVSITVDPEVDTPEVMTTFGTAMGADFDRWTFVTGEEDAIRALVVDGFRTYMGEKKESEDRPGVFDIGHGGRLVLVDSAGNVRAHYEVLTRDPETNAVTGVDEQGVDEVFHRAKHVVRAEREAKGGRGCSVGPRL